MVGCPVGMNIIQLWIQDTYLKGKTNGAGCPEPDTPGSRAVTLKQNLDSSFSNASDSEEEESTQLTIRSEIGL